MIAPAAAPGAPNLDGMPDADLSAFVRRAGTLPRAASGVPVTREDVAETARFAAALLAIFAALWCVGLV